MSEKFKKALRIAVNVGCGFEGDAEDAAELLTLIVGLESRIAELEATVEVGADIAKAYENRVSEIVALSNETVGKLNSRIAELEAEIERITVHSDIERQDDKSPNDTQTQTIVYGKERE